MASRIRVSVGDPRSRATQGHRLTARSRHGRSPRRCPLAHVVPNRHDGARRPVPARSFVEDRPGAETGSALGFRPAILPAPVRRRATRSTNVQHAHEGWCLPGTSTDRSKSARPGEVRRAPRASTTDRGKRQGITAEQRVLRNFGAMKPRRPLPLTPVLGRRRGTASERATIAPAICDIIFRLEERSTRLLTSNALTETLAIHQRRRR